MAEAYPLPAALDESSETERAHRLDLLTLGGPLRAAMLANETRDMPAAMLRQCWLWVHWLRITRGFRGSTTVARYAETLGRFGDWLRVTARDFAALDATDMDEWQKSLYVQRRNAAGWRRVQLHAVRSFYKFRRLRGWGVDPTDGVAGPRKIAKTPRKYTSPQLRALFGSITAGSRTPAHETRNRAMLLMLYATGARREELATLTLEQLEVAERIALVRFLGKGAKEREVPFEGPAVTALTDWLVARGNLPGVDTDRVFVSIGTRVAGKGLTPGAIERIVKRCAKLAELGSWGVHRFRVTFATHLYDDGHDLERIRILMGHTSIETTRGYLAVSERMRKVRLKSSRQHAALGTLPAGLPGWAKELEGKGNA